MPSTYTNRKGVTFYLCQGVTKTGKTRYYFARQPKGDPVEAIPAGYLIRESVNGVVSLAKSEPHLIDPHEVDAIEQAVATASESAQLSRERQAQYDRGL